jgi:hypothetical protein
MAPGKQIDVSVKEHFSHITPELPLFFDCDGQIIQGPKLLLF